MDQQAAVLQVMLDRLTQSQGVDLAATYGSFGTTDATPTSDVDIFFVPSEDEHDHSAALQVIVDDIGYDLWPVPWERLARIADLSDALTPLLLDSRVVMGDQAAIARFDRLRARCQEALAEPEHRLCAARAFVDRAAARVACVPDGQRLAVAEAVTTLLTGIAFSAGQYLHTSPGRVLDGDVDWLPNALRHLLRSALTATTPADRGSAIRTALERTARLIADAAPMTATSPADRAHVLTGFYEELHSLLNKIPRAAAAGSGCTNTLAVTTAVSEIGTHLCFLQTGLWPKDDEQVLAAYRSAGLPELLNGLDDPEHLIAQTGALMIDLPRYLESHGVRIRRVPDAATLAADLESDTGAL